MGRPPRRPRRRPRPSRPPVAPIETPSVRLSRHYGASPHALFDAWITPETVARWFAPSYEYQAHVDHYDPTPGGRYRIEMRHARGAVHAVAGVFETVDAPRKLVFSWAWEDSPMTTPSPSRVTVDLVADAGGTLLTLVHDNFDTQERATPHAAGWLGILWRLGGATGPDATRHVATTLALNARLFHNALDGVSPNDLATRTGPANHATWIAAHLAQCRVDMAGILGEEIETSLKAFQNAVPDDTPLPDLDAIHDVYRRASAGINRGLCRTTPQALAGPSPFPVPINDPTLGGLLDFLVDHDTYHLGQLGLLRRVHGYPAMTYDTVPAAPPAVA